MCEGYACRGAVPGLANPVVGPALPPAEHGPLTVSLGRGGVGSKSRGNRQKVPVESLLESAAELITRSFQERGFDIVITRSDVCNVGLRIEEVIAMRLYTGPMFEVRCVVPFNVMVSHCHCSQNYIAPRAISEIDLAIIDIQWPTSRLWQQGRKRNCSILCTGRCRTGCARAIHHDAACAQFRSAQARKATANCSSVQGNQWDETAQIVHQKRQAQCPWRC